MISKKLSCQRDALLAVNAFSLSSVALELKVVALQYFQCYNIHHHFVLYLLFLYFYLFPFPSQNLFQFFCRWQDSVDEHVQPFSRSHAVIIRGLLKIVSVKHDDSVQESFIVLAQVEVEQLVKVRIPNGTLIGQILASQKHQDCQGPIIFEICCQKI